MVREAAMECGTVEYNILMACSLVSYIAGQRSGTSPMQQGSGMESSWIQGLMICRVEVGGQEYQA